MVNKHFLFYIVFSLFSLTSVYAKRTGQMPIRGVECQYDTTVHRQIGPGATYTQFQFDNMEIGGKLPYRMRVHLVTIDMTNPYNRLTPFLTEDKYYKMTDQETDMQWRKEQGHKPVASVNGCNWIDRPQEGMKYTLYEVKDTHIEDNVIRYAISQTKQNFYVDLTGRGNIGNLTMKGSVTTASGQTAEIGQINHYRDYVRNTGQLALFCNGMDKAKDTQPEDGLEVLMKVAKSDDIKMGETQLTVVKKLKGCGTDIGKGQAVLTGVGDAEVFLNALKVGDKLTLDIHFADAAGDEVMPTDVFTTFIANCVSNGVAYGDPRKNVSYTTTGVSKDGKTVYWADLEMSEYSDAPLRCIEDFLINVGAWNAFYHDGGPSADMTVDGQFVSIAQGFHHRLIPSGVVLYSTAPEDAKIASVACDDPSPRKLNLNEQVSLQLYGYNQYGEMINAEMIKDKDIDIQCSAEIGTVADGVFTATHPGHGTIDVFYKKNKMLSVSVDVNNGDALKLIPKKIFTGEERSVQVKALLDFGTTVEEIDPAKLVWETDNQYVVSNCEGGLIVPQVDGFARVMASYGDVSDTLEVTVENLESADIELINLSDQLIAADDLDIHLPSVPYSFSVDVETTTTDSVTIYYSAGDSLMHKTIMPSQDEVHIESIMLDYDNPETYPVTVHQLAPYPAAKITRLVAYYTSTPSAIDRVANGKASVRIYTLDGQQTSKVPANTPVILRITTAEGENVVKKVFSQEK